MKAFDSIKEKKTIGVLLIALISMSVLYIGTLYKSASIPSQTTSVSKRDVYTCAMHPSVVTDQPGKCPICHMDLQKVESSDEGRARNGKEPKILFYRNPMRGEITSAVPAKDEMGMDYIPVYEDQAEGTVSGVDGRAGFSLSKERQQLIGVTSKAVVMEPLKLEIRATGKAAFDPELYTAVEEYRQALMSRSQMTSGPFDSIKQQSNELVSSSKTKLRLMGLTDGQIRKLGSGGTNVMNLILPKGNVWIYAEVFEYEVGGLKEGQTVEVVAPSVAGKTFAGTITSISPILNPLTRTVRVRALVPDPDGALRPDTFVNVKIQVDLGSKLVVPVDAVLHTGDSDFVFVLQEKGHFEPRKVTLGAKTHELYEVAAGLAAGETVVTSANFLIDSESRLRGVLQNAKSQAEGPPQTKGNGK